jgi:hypothetical protein
MEDDITYIRSQLEQAINGYSPHIAEMFNQLIKAAEERGVQKAITRIEACAIATMTLHLGGELSYVRTEMSPKEVRAWMTHVPYLVIDKDVLEGAEDTAPLVPAGEDDLP